MVTKGMALTRGVSLMIDYGFMVFEAAGYGGEMGQRALRRIHITGSIGSVLPSDHAATSGIPLPVSPRARGVANGAQEKSPHRDCPFAVGLRSRSDGGSFCSSSSVSHGKSSGSHAMSHTLGPS